MILVSMNSCPKSKVRSSPGMRVYHLRGIRPSPQVGLPALCPSLPVSTSFTPSHQTNCFQVLNQHMDCVLFVCLNLHKVQFLKYMLSASTTNSSCFLFLFILVLFLFLITIRKDVQQWNRRRYDTSE